MQNNEINVQEFVTERESDIKILEKAINSTRKKTMLFQRLPFYKRRRTRSNFVKKNKFTRRKHRHVLKTHIWYAKRFKMIKLNKVGLSLQRNQKSSKFMYKSQKRGFIFDESFKKTYVVDLNDPFLSQYNIDRSIINKIQLVRTKDGFIEIILTKRVCLVIISFSLTCKLIPLNILDSCISLIKMESVQLDDFLTDIDDSITNGQCFYVENINEYETGKLFLNHKDVMDVWNSFIKKGCIPVCIEELQRLALENDYMIYPFDDVNCNSFRYLEDTLNQQFIEKYERTPKSKKVAVNFDHLKIQTDLSVNFYIFELAKGVLTKNGFIFDKDDNIIGRIIRGSFCFSKGKSRGLCYTYDPIDSDIVYKSKNYDHENVYEMRFVKKLN